MRGVDLGPCLDDGEDLRRREVCEGEIVGWGKGEYVAFSFDGFGAEEEGGKIWRGLLVREYKEAEGRERERGRNLLILQQVGYILSVPP